MNANRADNRRVFEIMLVLIVLAMTSLLIMMQQHKIVILNLFYLPIVLAGYFLGRSSAGMIAVLSAISVTIAVTLDNTGFAAYSSPIMVSLVVTVWAGVLGLTALLVGTLCDERAATVTELHCAYVGVVEVLARYLQSANARIKARSSRVAELCQRVAEAMRLSQKQVDDIRVGALLYDIGNVEITTKLINRAVGSIESHPDPPHTFGGRELVRSLEPVLSGAVPLLLNQDDAVHECLAAEDGAPHDIPIGAKIIRAVRAYDALTGAPQSKRLTPQQAIQTLRKDEATQSDPEILRALERCVTTAPEPVHAEPAYAM